ncbi:AAA family ATPase [Nodularia sp. UHCC 0506]|uniref:AAA family ATPase n=1 Tax=Nodularia sp. UHCC 0506 TaxID=3110243 RepID=UPI002B20743D|nr:AAA family ATPase [Nodularia sp. UHCC 0506]MEA5512442.1 AAA family ATPase [Nodularia sp. UHCC 0506]
MLKQLILENWKSFRYAELPLDPLTVLIGTNASGKSNVVEALEFLQRIVQGENIEAALAGDKTLSPIRGGVEWAARKPESQFTLKALVQGEDETTDYLYVIKIETQAHVRVIEESIDIQILNEKITLDIKNFSFNNRNGAGLFYSPAELSSFKQFINSLPELNQKFDLDNFYEKYKNDYMPVRNTINRLVVSTLEKIFILNPIPSKMRDYSRLSDTLESDAANIAGVLAGLSDKEKEEVESALSDYIKDLPEGDIKKVWAEKVGRFGIDAMLYCQEEWQPGDITEIDARSMSDGTLRFLAILTALLTRPEGSQLVIEEIDNGLHPSRAKLLVKILREIGSKRNIDILITTHNPALLDALGPEIVPFVVVAHRDSETGESKLTILEEIDNLPLLLASGTLGKLATKGAIEKSLSENK